MAEEVIQKQMSLLPEYQEKYLKDLLANIYQTDEETGTITGIAAKNPLYGQPIYQTEDGSTTQDATQAMMDPDGNPVQFYETESGEYTTDASMAMMDQYGAPIFAVEGGVASPDVIGFTDPQTQAIARLTGGVDPVTGEQYESMMGSYQPFIDSSKETFDKGVSAVERSTGAYDPQGQIQYDTVTNADGTTSRIPRLDAQGNPVRSGGYEDFYDPFVEDVIDATYADIDRAGAIEGIGARAEAVGAGAYGGSRQGIVESELQRNIMDQKARTGSQLRSAAYTGAQQQAQSAFENQQSRGQTAGQLFQGLGTGIGALGEATQSLGFQDVNTLFNTGSLEQNQLQAQYDVQRAGQLEEAYEPFARFSYMRDILSGVPSSGTSLAASATPQASFLGGALQRSNAILGGQGGSNPILGGLGSIQNVSG
jgi:hypothetical protein|tara:strand:- start:999 stop:2270 length:1272 start_codon:yes stop_codon:yes gene_type:complete